MAALTADGEIEGLASADFEDRAPRHIDPEATRRFLTALRSVQTPGTRSSSDKGRRQIGFGFSPGDEGHEEPYFYANPWPLSPLPRLSRFW